MKHFSRPDAMESDVRNLIETIKRTYGKERQIEVHAPGKKGYTRWTITLSVPGSLPEVNYVLYPTIGNPERLGSVAIYSADAVARHLILSKTGTFFGHRILRCSLEQGRRTFVDVTPR